MTKLNKIELNIPARVKDDLLEIQKNIPEAAIAGGFLRDLYFGKQYKDIDIFIPNMSSSEISHVLNGTFDPRESTYYVPTAVSTRFYASEMHGASYMPQSEVTRIWNLKKIYQTVEEKIRDYNLNINDEYQIIMLAEGLNLKERISAYDFGVCQIYFDGENCYATDAFLKDAENKTFTLTFCEDQTQYSRSMRRWERLSARYPEFKLVVPDEFYSIYVNNSI